MGLFDFFGKKTETTSNEEKRVPWLRLTRMGQLDEIMEVSKTVPVAIFKHSTTCGISRMVFRNFESDYQVEEGKMKLYYLDLLTFRDVSNEVGYRFKVIHQSPQLLIIKNGVAVYHASHHSIHASDLEPYAS
ncbi:MAG: bacillithiol system redox-active protein YtxJ [Flavobacteriaceae bacterium]